MESAELLLTSAKRTYGPEGNGLFSHQRIRKLTPAEANFLNKDI